MMSKKKIPGADLECDILSEKMNNSVSEIF